jgi:hypothetical protein
MKYVLDHLNMPWDFDLLSLNDTNISINDILDHPELPWNYENVCFSKNISIKNVLDHPEIPWNIRGISAYCNITFRDFIEHPELPWDYSWLNRNHHIPKTTVRAFRIPLGIPE